MNIRHTIGFLHSFSIKNIFYNKILFTCDKLCQKEADAYM